MKTLSKLAVLALCTFAGAARAADDPQTGHWVLDVAKSQYITSTAPKSAEATITAWGSDGVSLTIHAVTATGEQSDIQYRARYDGKPYPRTEQGPNAIAGQMVTLKRVDAQTAERTAFLAGKAIGTERWVISADHTMRTVTQSGTNAAGKPINNVLVYVKQ
jgi:hypothetical protein